MKDVSLDLLTTPHRYQNSTLWRLTEHGVEVDDVIAYTKGKPATVRRIWLDYKAAILDASERYGVPVELIIATAATESKGRPSALRKEPKYKSDSATPHQISPGIMQTLISTARQAMGDSRIDRKWLLNPTNSITAGTAYISQQHGKTAFDPPKVACAYNAGGIYHQKGHRNRWKMRQYPIGTGKHADRFVEWFNDCFRMFEQYGDAPENSFYRMLNPVAPIPDVPVPEPVRAPEKKGIVKFIVDMLLAIFRGGRS